VSMTKIIQRINAHYDTLEVPFGRSYRWQQAHVVLECDWCGEKLTFSATSAINASSCCTCGADYGALIHDIRYKEEHLGDEDVHPWHYDLQGQQEQYQQDEAAHPRSSRWRYNDITSGFIAADEERWKTARVQQNGPSFEVY
jgi:hypothetical protein